MQEVSLGSDATERENYDNMSEVYAVVLAIEMTEKAFSQDAIEYKTYEETVTHLLGQYNSNWLLVKNSGHFSRVEDFLKDYRLEAPLAQHAIKLNRPINKHIQTKHAKLVGDITSSYITFSNYLEMGATQISELMSELDSLNFLVHSFQLLPNEDEAVVKVEKWFDIFKTMSASDELSEEQIEQIKMDITAAHNSFDRYLANS